MQENPITTESASRIENPAIEGRYRDLQIVAKGTSGIVWSAFDIHLNRKVAIKQISVESSNKNRIIAEVRLMGLLNHPGILRLLDVIQDRKYVYLTQPFCGRGSIESWGKQPEATLQARVKAFLLVLQGVRYLHSHNWVHGDIKPANILIDERLQPYLSDFGSAFNLSRASSAPAAELGWIGTAGYMAPELLRQESAPSIASDVFALGVTLYELLAGKRAFATDVNEAIQQSLNSKVPKLTGVALASLTDWNAIIQKATAPAPSDRYASAEKMGEDIRRLLQRLPLQAQRSSRLVQAKKWLQREPITAALIAATFLIAVLGLMATVTAWRTAATHLANLETEQKNFEEASMEVRKAQAKFTALIEEARIATEEAELQERLATEATRKIQDLGAESEVAVQKGLELASTFEKTAYESVDRWRAALTEASNLNPEEQTAASRKQIAEAQVALLKAIETSGKLQRPISTLPADFDLKTKFLLLIAEEIRRSKRIAIGKLMVSDQELGQIAFQSPLLPGGYFVTDWPDELRPIIFYHGTRVQHDVKCSEPNSLLIDLGEIRFPSTISNKGQGAYELLLQDSRRKPLSNIQVDIQYGVKTNTRFGANPISISQMVTSTGQGIVTLSSQIKGTAVVRVDGLQAEKLELETLSKSKKPLTIALVAPEFKKLVFNKLESSLANEITEVFEVDGADYEVTMMDVQELADSATSRADWRLKTRLSVLAMQMGDPTLAADMLKIENRPDPVQRTFFIECFGESPGDLVRIADVVKDSTDASLRSGLSLAVGSTDSQDAEICKAWQAVFSKWIAESQYLGVPSASRWAMKAWELPESPSSTKWVPPESKLKQIATGIELIRVPAGEGEFGKDKKIQKFREFWLGNKEVSWRQFQQMIQDPEFQDYRKNLATRTPPLSPLPDLVEDSKLDLPASVNWDCAMEFCNWLSRKDGQSECYERTGELHTVAKPMEGKPKDIQYEIWRRTLSGKGYRLAHTYAWEYACRAGTKTPFSFGDRTDLLYRYCVYGGLNQDSSAAPGSKLCNGWGLFDMHGNDWEWSEIGNWKFEGRRGGGARSPATECSSDYTGLAYSLDELASIRIAWVESGESEGIRAIDEKVNSAYQSARSAVQTKKVGSDVRAQAIIRSLIDTLDVAGLTEIQWEQVRATAAYLISNHRVELDGRQVSELERILSSGRERNEVKLESRKNAVRNGLDAWEDTYRGIRLYPLIAALRKRDWAQARIAIDSLKGLSTEEKSLAEDLFAAHNQPFPRTVRPADIDKKILACDLSRSKMEAVGIGYGREAYDVLEVEKVIMVRGRPYSKGFWAHAPSYHTYDLDKKWKRVTGRVGILDPGNDFSSVQFRIFGDDNLLWSSQVVHTDEVVDFDIDVTGVKTLKLETRDGGNGTHSDWGIWLNPRLER